jgi:hypothetical protein
MKGMGFIQASGENRVEYILTEKIKMNTAISKCVGVNFGTTVLNSKLMDDAINESQISQKKKTQTWEPFPNLWCSAKY